MIRELWFALLSIAPSAAHAGEIDEAATALVSELALPSVERFSVEDDLAIAVEIGPQQSEQREELARILGGLLLARLGALGAESAFLIDPGAEVDQRARDAGAEWLLRVRGEISSSTLSLFAELRSVDRGIWSTAVDVPILATAEHRSALTSLPKPIDPPPTPNVVRTDRAQLEGPAIRIQSIDQPVLALEACRLSDREADDLVVLTPDALAVYSLLDGRVRRIAHHDLGALPRSRTPSREAIGAVVCRGDRIAFGHSGLAGGHLLRATGSKKKLELAPAGELPGVPLAALPNDRWLLATVESGTSRYAKEMAVARGAELVKVALDAPIVDAAALVGETPESWRLVAVTADYRLLQLGETLAVTEKIGSSGVGISAFMLEGRPHVITTSARSDGGRDQLALHSGSEPDGRVPGVAVDGLVFATAVGRFRGAGLDLVAAALLERQRTDLFVLRLSEPKK